MSGQLDKAIDPPRKSRLLIRRRGLFLLFLFVGVLFLAGLLLPQWILLSPGMEQHVSRHFSVWAQAADRREAIHLRSALEDTAGQTIAFLGLDEYPRASYEIFIYSDRLEFNLHRVGLWAAWADTAGLVVEKRATQILLVSPGNPGLSHTADEVIQATCAAWIRPLVQQKSGQAAPWLSEGLVMYLSSFSRDDEDPQDLPPDSILSDMDELAFLARGGDRFADSLVAWLILRLGQKAVLELYASGGDFWAVLGRSPESVVAEWKRWASYGRPGDPRLWRRMPPGLEGD